MRSILYFILSVIALMLASCNGRKSEQVKIDKDSVTQIILDDSIVPELDSLATVIKDVAGFDDITDLFLNGSINLSDQQRKDKPSYLLTKEDIRNLRTQQEKNVAKAYLSVDQTIAKLYYMDDADFYSNSLNIKDANAFYEDMKLHNHLDQFYVVEAAYIVETLWIITNNREVFLPVIDDAHAESISKHITSALRGINLIAKDDPDMKKVADLLQPLICIDVTSANDLRGRLVALSGEVGKARNAFLGKK